MPREFTRAERVADALQRELAVLIREEMGDPRVNFVNITGVDVSRDLAAAKVHVNYVEAREDAERHAGVKVLNGASGFLRTKLAKRMQLRIVPSLKFIYDDSGRRGQELSALIDTALAADRHHDNQSEDE
ncbi:MAG: 30S ribosome-binding factor RbfA [Gammaproteobacteria bacterium]|nr:30S ribosome-binding factor RbfA [Gammaproteobacteria bacterium]MBQ0840012.1 30S ribosome-binding factor RbfA [Gammaproteobacteria bacterium]